MSFQNLEAGRKRVLQGWGFDLADAVTEAEWSSASKSFQKRHLLAHRMGVINEEYLQKAGDPHAVVGRKVTLTAPEITELIGIIEKLGRCLYDRVKPS